MRSGELRKKQAMTGHCSGPAGCWITTAMPSRSRQQVLKTVQHMRKGSDDAFKAFKLSTHEQNARNRSRILQK